MKIQVHQAPHQIKLSGSDYTSLCQNIANEIELDAESCAIIFVDDNALKDLHGRYLDDPTETDVITFDLGEEKVEGEIYISTDRASAQAREYNVTLKDEIVRLIIHGLLHLKGYDDQTDGDRLIMKREENRLVELIAKTNE